MIDFILVTYGITYAAQLIKAVRESSEEYNKYIKEVQNDRISYSTDRIRWCSNIK